MLTSPCSGRALFADTPHSLSDGGTERWPVIDGIPYLRAGSQDRARGTLALLDAGDFIGATVLLLAENDFWWDEAPPAMDALREVVAGRDSLTLRDVMARLGWGRVGDYFAHRWSDPTFVAGLALTDAYWHAPRTGLELACGIGHHLRAWRGAGVAVTGGDVVWAKLWVARHFLLGEHATLLCFNADAPWPIRGQYDLVACHDAFYFLRNKQAMAARLLAAASQQGVVVAGHVHNRDAPGYSSGLAVTLFELIRLFPDAVLFDDAALTEAGGLGRAPCPAGMGALERAHAFSLAAGPGAGAAPRAACGPLSLPRAGTRLVRNPLLTRAGIAWPSARYRDEYAALVRYGAADNVPEEACMSAAFTDAAARRELLALPERW